MRDLPFGEMLVLVASALQNEDFAFKLKCLQANGAFHLGFFGHEVILYQKVLVALNVNRFYLLQVLFQVFWNVILIFLKLFFVLALDLGNKLIRLRLSPGSPFQLWGLRQLFSSFQKIEWKFYGSGNQHQYRIERSHEEVRPLLQKCVFKLNELFDFEKLPNYIFVLSKVVNPAVNGIFPDDEKIMEEISPDGIVKPLHEDKVGQVDTRNGNKLFEKDAVYFPFNNLAFHSLFSFILIIADRKRIENIRIATKVVVQSIDHHFYFA